MECWTRPAAGYWSRMSSTSMETIGSTQYDREGAGGVPCDKEILIGRMKQTPALIFDV